MYSLQEIYIYIYAILLYLIIEQIYKDNFKSINLPLNIKWTWRDTKCDGKSAVKALFEIINADIFIG